MSTATVHMAKSRNVSRAKKGEFSVKAAAPRTDAVASKVLLTRERHGPVKCNATRQCMAPPNARFNTTLHSLIVACVNVTKLTLEMIMCGSQITTQSSRGFHKLSDMAKSDAYLAKSDACMAKSDAYLAK
eukprot:4474913-Pleurochrysis_carterae.AAC.1